MKTVIGIIVAALVGLPFVSIIAVAVMSAAISGASADAVTASAVACAYGNPQPQPLLDAMRDVHPAVFADDDHRDTIADRFGLDHLANNTGVAHTQLPVVALGMSLHTVPGGIPATLITWWHGTLPADNDDTAWTATRIDGYGTLDTYIAAVLNTYPQHLDPTYTCTPPVGTCPQPAHIDAALATIRHLESANRYTEASRAHSTGAPAGTGWPSGAYQFLRSTWNNHAGYPEAYLAPPDIQDERATLDITRALDQFNADISWVPVYWYIGPTGAQHVHDGHRDPNQIPNPTHNTLTITDYRDRWMAHYIDIALPAHGITPNHCPQHGALAVAWAETQLGAPYIAANPYRFGHPTSAGTITGIRGDTYTYPPGTIGYDCSGFVITAWQHAGYDHLALHSIYSSQQFNHPDLTHIAHRNIQPGDLAVYAPLNGIGHIVMIHSTAPDGTVRTIEASPRHGVHIGTINWSRVTTIVRPPV